MLRGRTVVLRDLREDEAEAYAQAGVDDPGLDEALGEEAVDAADVRRRVRDEPRRRREENRIELAIADASTDALLGSVVVHHVHAGNARAELGIWVVPGARRRGVALDALRVICDWCFDGLGLVRIGVATAPENVAMQRLAERAGFTREGILRSYTRERGRHVDHVVFSLLTHERTRSAA